MSFCFLYNVVSENHSAQNSPPGGGGGSIASSRSIISALRDIKVGQQYMSGMLLK